DILFRAAVADGPNFSNSGFQNIGSFTSEGIEFTINADIFESDVEDGFNWNMNFNAAYIKREIKDLTLDQDVRIGEIGGGTGGTVQLHRVGVQPFAFFPYKQIYDASNNPIEGAFADLNGDNIINDDDRYLYKKSAPDITLGFRSGMSFKKFDLSFNL